MATEHVLLCGVSTRAAAASAARAGYRVTALDGYADRDQAPGVRALSTARDFGRPFSAHAAADIVTTLTSDAVVYLSNFENEPAAVATLAEGRMLLGNPPDVLARVRDPFVVADVLGRRGLTVPRVGDDVENAIVKPRRSGGGHHVRRSHAGEPAAAGSFRQEYIDGIPGSIVFVAARGRCVPLGITRQLIGDPAFSVAGYRYCGNLLVNPNDLSALTASAIDVAAAVADEFDLIGVNGIDFIARGDVAVPIEVNPRWTAAMELVERAYGVSVFDVHAEACRSATLPSFDFHAAAHGTPFVGKAVVFANHAAIAGDTDEWLRDGDVRDVPHAGDRIPEGAPVCTILSDGADADTCYTALVQRAAAIHAWVERWKTEPDLVDATARSGRRATPVEHDQRTGCDSRAEQA